ncbi:hypothetical protein R3P38DRAFT_3254348 [Favolaschia claudopus]|uniref:Uncharacterized protein n=1 Tax=Favolaschia claudopus TaxID=2862362 RepID=A0AAW0DM96_9AGAR
MEFQDPTIASLARQTGRDNTASVSSSSSVHHTAPAPSVPDAVHEKAKTQALKLSARIKATAKDPTHNNINDLITEADEWAKTVQERESPITKANRVKQLADWQAIILLTEPELPVEQHWDLEVVKRFWKRYLYIMTSTTPSRTPGKPLKSRTVSAWAAMLIHSIVLYTRDPNTQLKCGLRLLITDGLYQNLKDQVMTLVHEFKLDRHYDPRVYFGRAELGLIFETMLSSTKRNGRQVALQTMVRALYTFFFTLRGSSLGPSHKIWRDLNYVLLCGHLKIYCKGYADWEIMTRVLNYKNQYNSVTGGEQDFTARGVLHSHNALFDITTFLMAHLYLLKRFKKKYKTIDELLEDQSAEIELDPAFADTALFLEAAPGGKEFASPEVAAMSRSTTDSFRDWSGKTGLPKVGLGALRRETGNMYIVQLGKQLAEDVMNHEAKGTIRDFYSRNMGNLDLVRVRLGEVAGVNESAAGMQIKESDKRHAFMGPALECLIRRAKEEPAVHVPRNQKIRDDREEIKDNPDLVPLAQAADQAWEAFLACFNSNAADSSQTQHKRLMDYATGRATRKQKPVNFRQPWTEATLQTAYTEAQQVFLKKQTAILRQDKRQQEKTKSNDLLHGPLTGTAGERLEILDLLKTDRPSEHLKQALDNARASATAPQTYDKSGMEKWSRDLQRALTTVQVIEGHHAAEDDKEGDQDTLYEFFDKLALGDPMAKLLPPPSPDQRRAPPKPIADDDTEDDSRFTGDPIDESQEIDILQVPIAETRVALLKYLVEPVETAREYKQYLTVADGPKSRYKCPKCPAYVHMDPIPDPLLANIGVFERHIIEMHSQWKELELEIVVVNADGEKEYRCPAGDFSDATSVRAVRTHATSDECVKSSYHQALLRAHEQQVQRVRHRQHDEVEVEAELNDGEVSAESGEPHGMVVPMHVIAEAIEVRDDDRDRAVGNVMLDYLEKLGPETALPAGKKREGVSEQEWEELDLDRIDLNLEKML